MGGGGKKAPSLICVAHIMKLETSSSPKDILESEKKNKKKLYTLHQGTETTSKAATSEFLSKIANRNKISNEDFTLCEEEIILDEII